MADGVSAIKLAAGLLWDERSMTRRRRFGRAEPTPTGARPPGVPLPAADEARILVRLPAALWRELRPGEDPSSTATSARTARSPGRPSRSSG